MPVSKKGATFFDKDFKPESISDVLNVYDQKWIEKLRASLEKNGRVASSVLQSSMVAEHTSSPTYVSFQILGAKYWDIVDKGVSGTEVKYDTDKKFTDKAPPISSMMEFITNRGIVPREGKTEAAYKSLAFMLGQSIKKKGIEPTHFVKEAITDKDIQELKKAVRKAIKKGLV